MGSPDLLRRIILPIASSDDAHNTCEAAFPYIANANGDVIAVYVIEINPGAPNKAPPLAVKEHGEQALAVVETVGEEYSIQVQTEIRSGPVVREAVFEVAHSEAATSVGLVPRSGSRIGKVLSGDNALSMITQNDLPVVVFPRAMSPPADEIT